MNELTREQWIDAWVAYNTDGEEGTEEYMQAYRAAEQAYDSGGTACARCGRARLLVWAESDTGGGPRCCLACLGDEHGRLVGPGTMP